MNPFIAVILICLKTVAPAACNETTAADVLSTGVENELNCVMGWQDVVAHSALAHEIGKTAYVKTLCRRAGRRDGKPSDIALALSQAAAGRHRSWTPRVDLPWEERLPRFLAWSLRAMILAAAISERDTRAAKPCLWP